MISSRISRRLILSLILVVVPGPVSAQLSRVERHSDDDRDRLLAADVPLVLELEHSFLARGSADQTRAAADLGLATEVLDPKADGTYLLVGRPGGVPETVPGACGVVLWTGDDWALTRLEPAQVDACAEVVRFIRRLPTRILGPRVSPPAEYADWSLTHRQPLAVQPLVEELVTNMTDDDAWLWWEGLVNSATTRNSYTAGCQTAANWVADAFTSFGLQVETQYHTSGMAPNVIGTLPGTTRADDLYVVIGHLDDMPSSGAAPGADDNASGAAMVVALAEAMSCMRYEGTIQFVVVTGEEYGLYGSEAYAQALATAGTPPVAALNGDMIGWEGNGTPNPEDLDVNLNATSSWLGATFAQAASDYATGLTVNAFQCGGMLASDHAPFWENGWSAMCGITDNEGYCSQTGHYPYYHTSDDTLANCGPGAHVFYGAAVRGYLATLAHLAVPVERVIPHPSDLSAAAAGEHQIDLGWTAGAAGLLHEVLRSPGGCTEPGPEVSLGMTAAPAFSDVTASGAVTYGYTVRSWDGSGVCVSGRASCTEATTTGSCTEPPTFSGLTSASDLGQTTCSVTLDWPAADPLWCGGPARYRIYRSSDPTFVPGPATLIADNLATTSWIDTDSLVSHQPSTWIVRAVDATTGVEDLNLVRVSTSPTGPVALGTWLDDGGDSTPVSLETTAPWHVAPGEGRGGGTAWITGTYGSNQCAGLATPELALGPAPELRFWSHYNIETGWDKGEVQISTDDGVSWQRLPLLYPTDATHTGDSCGLPTGTYFTGNDATWTEYTASLSTWAGQAVRLRFLLSTDVNTEATGWWIDDVRVIDAGVPGTCLTGTVGHVFSDGFESAGTASWTTTVGG